MKTETRSDAMSPGPRCRFCGSALTTTVVDLGMSPLCQTHISPEDFAAMEPFYPLRAYVCDDCFLVQLQDFVQPAEIFSDYAYLSSYSDSWVQHARRFCAEVTSRFKIGPQSRVTEIASNDGYLLQHFISSGIPARGIEPAGNVAKIAISRGIPTTVAFFGSETARQYRNEHGGQDLLVGNNVLAHVPDINDFVSGLGKLLADGGVISIEFPHLLQLIRHNQFDTIYHEHFSYLALFVVRRIFAHHGLRIFDVQELPTHGGSLRIFACHERGPHATSPSVATVERAELAAGLHTHEAYREFAQRVKEVKWTLLSFLIDARRSGKRVVGYGAPGKGNTLLNYCGIRTDFLDFTVDRNPLKQGKFTPGTRIPILAPEAIGEAKPDYVLILPWNLRNEIVQSFGFIRDWGGRFVVPIPSVEIVQ